MNKEAIIGLTIGITLGIILGLSLLPAQAEAAEDYWEVNIFAGTNKGRHWNNDGELGSGYGAGYHRRLWHGLWGAVRYEHVSQLMSGAPFNTRKAESNLDHLGVVLEWRFGE
jgi:hypothetical protein